MGNLLRIPWDQGGEGGAKRGKELSCLRGDQKRSMQAIPACGEIESAVSMFSGIANWVLY